MHVHIGNLQQSLKSSSQQSSYLFRLELKASRHSSYPWPAFWSLVTTKTSSRFTPDSLIACPTSASFLGKRMWTKRNQNNAKAELLIKKLTINEKRINFLGQKLKKCSIMSIWLFSARVHYFFLVTYLLSVPRILEITHVTQCIRDFLRDECSRNMSEEKSAVIQGLIYAEIWPSHALYPSLPEL